MKVFFVRIGATSAHKVALRFLQLGMFTKSIARKLVTPCTKISANEYVLPNQLP